jgi:phosphoribosylformylglycinamidine (FGAM) synthase-like enzyme
VLIFNETQSRIIISVKKQNASAALALLEWRGVPARRLGTVTKSDTLRMSADGKTFGWSLTDLDAAWSQTIEKLLREEI